MQIKHFEAADMTAALNRIKQDFGPDAVILSARSIQRKTGLLGLLRKDGVEVTAAIDAPKKKMEDRPAEVRRPALAAGGGGSRPVTSAHPAATYQRSGMIHVQRTPPHRRRRPWPPGYAAS